MILTSEVKPKQGKAVRLPHTLYTQGLHHCLAVALYSPQVGVIGLAHVFDERGKFGTDGVVDSLLEEMVGIGSTMYVPSIRAYLIGELDESLAMPENRTERVSAALARKKISIINKMVGGRLWRDVYFEAAAIRVVEYREDWAKVYEEFQAEQVYNVSL